MKAAFWKDKRVLITGHTGFKGAWVAILLARWGAKITGASLEAEGEPNLWRQVRDRVPLDDRVVDLRDRTSTAELCRSAQPEIVLHLAAQAQVRTSYREPVETLETNVMGSVNLLEALRSTSVRTILVVTSDKVYSNADRGKAFSENDPLGGSDPYSSSKAAADLIAFAYAESFFAPQGVALGTARGGNVIGGGDFSSDRLVPDIYRAVTKAAAVELRYPEARRPWQHVLDCLSGYLAFVEFLARRADYNPIALNFGPTADASMNVSQIADAIAGKLESRHAWRRAPGNPPFEKSTLALEVRRANQILGWHPRLDLGATIDWTAQWYADFARGHDPLDLTTRQIGRYLER